MRQIKVFAALLALLLLVGCGAAPAQHGGVAATTGPVAQFAMAIMEGTDIPVTQVVTDSVSCLHDYSLSVRQMETIEKSQVVLISGAGLEGFMGDALEAANTVVDCSAGLPLRTMEGHHHEDGEAAHDQEKDPHIWLDPVRAGLMADNICAGLSEAYPDKAEIFRANNEVLQTRLAALKQYGDEALADLSCREIITFHDGFSYLAESFDLTILASIEEEAGSEASAADLMEIIDLVKTHGLPAVFTEKNGSDSAASVIQSETGVNICTLDMAMGGSDYFEAMKQNFDTLKEALQ